MNFIKTDNIKKRIISDYQQYGRLYVGVDFDDTIRDYELGTPIMPVVEVLKKLQEHNQLLCLYTAREGSRLVEAEQFCKGIGLKISYVNWSPAMPECRKPLFNILLDDRAGLNEALDACIHLIEHIEQKY